MLFLRRSCWVCFATVEDDYDAKWVKPCRCRGTTKWVHQTCLQRWVDEKQKGNSSAEVYCPQCGTRYIIVFPEFGRSTPSHQPVYIYVVNRLISTFQCRTRYIIMFLDFDRSTLSHQPVYIYML